MWQYGLTSGWENDSRLYSTTKPNEFAAVMSNLRRYFALLKASRSSGAVEAAYIHREASGVVAVDSYGFDGVEPTRIYTFADDQKRVLHLLCIGKTETKETEMAYCKNLVYYIVNEPKQTTTTTEGRA